MTHPNRRGVSMDMADEALRARIGRPHRSAGHQSEETHMHLQGDVLATAEGSTYSTEGEPDAIFLETEAGSDLATILMQPLRCHEELHAGPVVVGNSDGRFEAEEGLVLHADLVGALDGDFPDQVLIATNDPLMAYDVAVGVNRFEGTIDRLFRVEKRLEDLVGDDDQLDGTGAGLRIARRDRRHCFPHEPHFIDGE